jgi:hypothetical protein
MALGECRPGHGERKPRPSDREASAEASCNRSCAVATCNPERHTASTSTTAGSTAANSAVTLPRSGACRGLERAPAPRVRRVIALTAEGEGIADEVGQDATDLITPHDDNK